jgi:CubicO group peptidase (beta-lactamase class C family)
MKPRVLKVLALLLSTSLIAISASAQQTPSLQKQAPAQQRILNLPQGLTEAQARAHVIAPAHVQNIVIEEVNPARENFYKFAPKVVQFKTTPHLDVGAFGTTMHNILKDQVTGYILQVRQNGNLIYNLIWNWSKTPVDGNKGWNEDTRMHVASVSKYLTAVGLVKLLDSKGISYDAKIIGYLPTYWTKGPNIDKISFRNLLNHKSGFSTGGSSSDYSFMKARVAAGVPAADVGTKGDYENMNFGLMRILMPIINGNVNKSTDFFPPMPGLNDAVWDAVTLYHYRNYMQAGVFSPAGVNNVQFAPLLGGQNALAYKFPAGNIHGWDSGNLASVAGGAGWRLSTKELLNVMNHMRRKNTIIPAAKAQLLLDGYFGIDQVIDTPAGKLYNKNGAWGTGDKRVEQCVAYFFPNGMEVVVFVNSPISTNDPPFSLRGLVKDAFINNLQG